LRRGRAIAGERGAALVELAMTVPVLLLMITGISSIGLFLEQDMQLTDAVNVAAKELAISRGNTTDPCNLVYSAVTAAAPYLTPASMTLTTNLNGNSYPGNSCGSGSTTTGAAGNLVQGEPASVTVTYPCSLAVYGNNLVPGCTIVAQLSEIVQ